MSGSPWMGVLFIAGAFGGGLLFLLLILKFDGLRNALTQTFRLPVLIALLVVGFGASILTILNGTGDSPGLAFLIALHLLSAADAPRERWARVLLWLDGAVLAGVTAWFWVVGRDFAGEDLWIKALTVAVIGLALWTASVSLLRLFRPPQTPIAETGTPA